jgi:hypothetical protein
MRITIAEMTKAMSDNNIVNDNHEIAQGRAIAIMQSFGKQMYKNKQSCHIQSTYVWQTLSESRKETIAARKH